MILKESLPKQKTLFDEPVTPEIFEIYKIDGQAISRQQSVETLDKLMQMRPVKQNLKSGGFAYKFPTTKQLIADFSLGYAKNWAFQIHGVFAKSLDIKDKLLNKTELKASVKPYKTQGCLFNFTANQMIYDTPFAYLSPWKECLKYIKYGIQIDEAGPACLIEPAGKRVSGLVAGWIFINKGDRIEKKKYFSMTQDDFVRLLIKGFEEEWLNES